MNAGYFVLVAALLAFATGFFVAAIIWGIKVLMLSPKREEAPSKSVHLLHIFSRSDFNHEFAAATDINKSGKINLDSIVNKELYQYYHGRN